MLKIENNIETNILLEGSMGTLAPSVFVEPRYQLKSGQVNHKEEIQYVWQISYLDWAMELVKDQKN